MNQLRVISWIESWPKVGDPLTHTKNHENKKREKALASSRSFKFF